jgi:WD40 repeat protein
MAYSRDSRLLATAGDAGIVSVWETDTGRSRFRVKAHTSWSSCFAFSPDGKILASGSHDRTIQLLDAETGQVLKTLKGHTDEIKGLAFTSDGRRLFSGCQDETIRIWDVESGQHIKTWKGHSSGVTGIALTPDNQRLASSSSDQTVRIWDVESGKLSNVDWPQLNVWRAVHADGQTRDSGWDKPSGVGLHTGLELTSLKGADPASWASRSVLTAGGSHRPAAR